MPIENPPSVRAPWPPPNSRPGYHQVKNRETWETVAHDYGISVNALILHNFRTLDPAVVNWYLREYVGCNLPTGDGKNWRFSSSTRPGKGKIYIPQSHVTRMDPVETKADPEPETVLVNAAWSRYRSNRGWIWRCNNYCALNYPAINNLAQYGQPVMLYEPGFNEDYVPDFANIVVEMPHSEVMNRGYGQTIDANSFPVVGRFLRERLRFPVGTYTFRDLVQCGFARGNERFISRYLYSMGLNGMVPGCIGAADAAYVHGSVSFALMGGTRFTYTSTTREVDAEIGAGEDNWDNESDTVPYWVSVIVAETLGPERYNLEEPIRFQFTGPGKRSKVWVSTLPMFEPGRDRE